MTCPRCIARLQTKRRRTISKAHRSGNDDLFVKAVHDEFVHLKTMTIMEFEIVTLEGKTITASLEDVGAVFKSDDVIYINGTGPCVLSSAKYKQEGVQREKSTNRP